MSFFRFVHFAVPLWETLEEVNIEEVNIEEGKMARSFKVIEILNLLIVWNLLETKNIKRMQLTWCYKYVIVI